MELSDATGKFPATLGIDPGTFRLVAQCLNHYATPGPLIVIMSGELAGERLVSVYSAEESSLSSIISRRWRRGYSSDMVGDNTGQGLVSTGDRKVFSHNMIHAWVIEGTTWKCSGMAVQQTVDCSYTEFQPWNEMRRDKLENSDPFISYWIFLWCVNVITFQQALRGT